MRCGLGSGWRALPKGGTPRPIEHEDLTLERLDRTKAGHGSASFLDRRSLVVQVLVELLEAKAHAALDGARW